MRKSNAAILTAETAVKVGAWAVAYPCYHVRATGGSLPCRRYFLASLTGNKEVSKDLMVLRVKPYQQSLCPDEQHTLAFNQVCVTRGLRPVILVASLPIEMTFISPDGYKRQVRLSALLSKEVVCTQM